MDIAQWKGACLAAYVKLLAQFSLMQNTTTNNKVYLFSLLKTYFLSFLSLYILRILYMNIVFNSFLPLYLPTSTHPTLPPISS